MKDTKAISALFVVSAIYDGALGIGFLFAPGRLFELVKVTPPNHAGYVQFSAALLIVFAIMFLAIAKDPKGNKGLILYGILLKLSYCGVVFYYWFTSGIPHVWKPFAVVDLVFLAAFVMACSLLSKQEAG